MDTLTQNPDLKTEMKRITILDLKNGNVEKSGVRTKRMSRENLVAEIYLDKGVEVFRTTPGEKPNLEEINAGWVKERINSLSGYDYEKMFNTGIPDYLIVNTDNKSFFFVEVKSEGDGLSKSQIKWLRAFDRVPFKIAYVT